MVNDMYSIKRIPRFLMWLLLTIALMITHFHRVNLNVLADRLMLEFNLSGISLGNLAAAYSYIYIFMQIPGGVIIDRFGSRRVGFVSCLLMGTGSIMFGCSHSIAGIFIGRLLIGLGASVVMIYILKFQSLWYSPNEFATMTGLAIFIGGMGALVGTFPLAYVIRFVSWQTSFFTTGVAAIILSILCLLLVKDHPGNVGMANANQRSATKNNPDKHNSLWHMAVLTVTNKQLWLPFLVYFGVYGSFIALTGAWGITYLMQIYNISRSQAALVMLPASLGVILGAPIAGYLSDRLKNREILIFITSLLFLINWTLLIIYGGKPPLLMMYVIGFNLGITASATNLNLTYAKEISKSKLAASSVAFVNAGLFAGAAVLQLSFGYILQRGWAGVLRDGVMLYPVTAYVRSFMFCWGVAGVSTVASLIMVSKKRLHIRNPKKL